MGDPRARLANRVQLTSDGHKAYLEAVEGAFGADVDYAQLVKLYGAAPENMEGRYSPAECIGAHKDRIEGNPDPKHVSTSYAERQKPYDAHANAPVHPADECVLEEVRDHMQMVALFAVWYYYVRQHKSLKGLPPGDGGSAKRYRLVDERFG